MYKFIFNVFDGSIMIYDEEENLVADRIALDNNFAFQFLTWVQDYLDKKDLVDVEYQVLIRIH